LVKKVEETVLETTSVEKTENKTTGFPNKFVKECEIIQDGKKYKQMHNPVTGQWKKELIS